MTSEDQATFGRSAKSAERRDFYPVAEPALVGNEREYVLDCIDSTWISSKGKYIEKFEQSFASFCDVGHALTCSNGTVALHLALLAAGVGPGDEVIVPTLTYVATANAVMYCGGTPVFVDSEPTTWNLDPAAVERAITPRTRAIIPVHLYGHPANMSAIMEFAGGRGITVIEDAAEAHGAEHHGQRVGSIGDIATFSFFGNKIITTGEGGMVTTNNADFAAKVRTYRGQGLAPDREYWFPTIGYNYRMTNIAAALGVAQLERVDWHMQARRNVSCWYQTALADTQDISFQPELPGYRNAYWMTSVLLHGRFAGHRDSVRRLLRERGVETRPFFPPIHQLPPYVSLAGSGSFPVADSLAARGFNVPSSSLLNQDDVVEISGIIRGVLDDVART